MSDDAVLDRIDATIGGLCACGCETRLESGGPSAYWASSECMARWQGRTQAEAPHEVYRRPDAHMLDIPPAESDEPVTGIPGSRVAAAMRRSVARRDLSERYRARMEGRRPSSSTLEDLRQAMVEHLHEVMNDPGQASWASRDRRFFQTPWPVELDGGTLTEMQLVSSDGRRWSIRPGRQARATFTINRLPVDDVGPYGRRPHWSDLDQQETSVTVVWTGPWELQIAEPASAESVPG